MEANQYASYRKNMNLHDNAPQRMEVDSQPTGFKKWSTKDRQEKDYYQMELTEERNPHCIPEFDRQHHMSKQINKQRSAQASMQMVYTVFGNAISILEEFEERERQNEGDQGRLERSKIYLPPQGHKSDKDVEAIVQTQLMMFQSVLKQSPSEVKDEMLGKLKSKTLEWAAVRENAGTKRISKTDEYISNMYEIIVEGKTVHAPVTKKEFSKKTMLNGLQYVMQANEEVDEMEKAFKEDENKQATEPETRASDFAFKGAERISRTTRGNLLLGELTKDYEAYRRHVPDHVSHYDGR